MTQWLPVPGAMGHYEVSSDGKIRRTTARTNTQAGRLVATHFNPNGYEVARLSINGWSRSFYIHRLVAEAFIGDRPAGHDVNHVDGNKRNNAVGNLAYVTRKENIHHAIRIGLTPIGSRSVCSKLTVDQVAFIREAAKVGRGSQTRLSRQFGVAESTISNLVNGRTYRDCPPSSSTPHA